MERDADVLERGNECCVAGRCWMGLMLCVCERWARVCWELRGRGGGSGCQQLPTLVVGIRKEIYLIIFEKNWLLIPKYSIIPFGFSQSESKNRGRKKSLTFHIQINAWEMPDFLLNDFVTCELVTDWLLNVWVVSWSWPTHIDWHRKVSAPTRGCLEVFKLQDLAVRPQ